ncbi:hypothetical protein HRR83_005408 [Exophiala dermatitidis]|uniref:Uncharacterized protein n=1 Tax=Exophiala dermatitidis TaxID=5970 RepID=A0AAN6ETI5_EXODE|nr:hypothetical protein HRR74_005261 [Exophiala dermatitidis]KAJ4518491.1 hypothetical protein HRR73_004072 [Exophiala dermatitidis]KAJ4533988.1 hypothetical protein HRR76_005936 [Exophiala dermatitidis]KAJ4550144.1 hypothetical protein HRR77_003622 [Exophiala dermatitidis]KAJ4571607.1 hypothetical protein HRR81_005638 [Exophiala dermatitidis]
MTPSYCRVHWAAEESQIEFRISSTRQAQRGLLDPDMTSMCLFHNFYKMSWVFTNPTKCIHTMMCRHISSKRIIHTRARRGILGCLERGVTIYGNGKPQSETELVLQRRADCRPCFYTSKNLWLQTGLMRLQLT